MIRGLSKIECLGDVFNEKDVYEFNVMYDVCDCWV